MSRITFITLLLLNLALAQSQNLLDSKWKFTTGDDPSWTRPEVDDSKWTDARIGEMWESWGYKNYDGFGWYRKQVVISSKLKAEAEKNGGLTLKLARIDDVDFTYFNGQLVGQTGDVPPHLQAKYDVDRVYNIPANLILWDKPNTIAVRVYDNIGGGGIYGSDVSLMVRGVKDMFKIAPAMVEPDRIIKGLSNYNLPIEINNESANNTEGKLKVVIMRDFLDTFLIKESNVVLAANAKVVIQTSITQLKPGIYLVFAEFNAEGVNKRIKFNFAVDPEKMTTVADTQPDFTQYWAKAKRELSAVDPHYKLIKVDSLSTAARNCYVVEMRSLGNVLIRAWLLTPKKAGKYPAVLTVQGYSSYLQPDWTFTNDNVVSLGLNIRGHGNSKDDVNPGFPGYLYYNIEDKEKFIYRGAYMDCVRAIDFLFSLTNVDTTRVAVEGGSQGGALSFATAALCGNRIKAVVPAVPFLSNFPEYIKVGAWPANEWYGYAAKNPSFGIVGELKTLSYIDIKNLAPWVTAPVYMGVGLMDEVCPPRINFAAFNNLNVEKYYSVYPDAGHGLPSEFNEVKIKFINEKLGLK